MKITRILLMALAAVVIAGTVASASTLGSSRGEGAERTARIAALATDEVTTDDGTTDDGTTDDGTTDDGTTDEVCADATDEVTTDEVTTDDGTTDETCGDGTEDLVEVAPTTFADCAGLTGLDNAICRHEVLLGSESLLESDSDHGLAHALEQLKENKAKHDAEATHVSGEDGTTDDGTDDEVTTTSDTSSSPGQSGEAHGQSGESHGNSGH
jgi:hypothetical protein